MNENFPVFQKMPSANCCGCEGCANVCPKKIIHFKEDGEGFRFPDFKETECIHCGACVRVCPQLKSSSCKVEKQDCYAGFSRNENIVESSSSGGYFSHIVEAFKKKHPQGKFVGVVWSDDYRHTEFIISDNFDDLKKVRVAKYIQARKNEIYRRIKKELTDGTPILFSGCPCEVAALVSCLGKIPDYLYLVDFVCKGAASEKVMREYLDLVAKDKIVTSLNMRVVGGGAWIPQWMKITFANHKTLFKAFYSTILGKAFRYLQREACYKCEHCGKNRNSDLTLGDFHGADPNKPYYNARGTSVIVVNSLKGEQLLNDLKESCVVERVSYEEISRKNPRIEHAWAKDVKRDSFGKTLSKKGLFAAYIKVSSPKVKLITMARRLFHLPL